MSDSSVFGVIFMEDEYPDERRDRALANDLHSGEFAESQPLAPREEVKDPWTERRRGDEVAQMLHQHDPAAGRNDSRKLSEETFARASISDLVRGEHAIEAADAALDQ